MKIEKVYGVQIVTLVPERVPVITNLKKFASAGNDIAHLQYGGGWKA